MPDVLDFNPNRDLGFDHDRSLKFDPNRKLGFDSSRDRGFKPDRDLGFGKRGPVFRGFMCPICGAQVTADQPTCTECGAVFDPKASPPPKAEARPSSPQASPTPNWSGQHPRADVPPRRAAPLPPTRAYPTPAKRPDAPFCIYCGARLASDDTFCWQCGNQVTAGIKTRSRE